MSDRKWRSTGRSLYAGDYFGDDQVGDAVVVTYHLDGAFREYKARMVPTVRVSVYFGVEMSQDSGGVEYSARCTIELQRLDVDGDVIEEYVSPYNELFPLVYSTYQRADIEMRAEVNQWVLRVWGVSDFWDGKDMPRE